MSDDIEVILNGLADTFTALFDSSPVVGALIPSPLRASSAHWAPAEDQWMNTTESPASFNRPTVKHSLILVAPAFDWPERQRWLHAHVSAVQRFYVSKPTFAPGRPVPRFLGARIGLIDLDQSLIGATCEFMPIQIKEP